MNPRDRYNRKYLGPKPDLKTTKHRLDDELSKFEKLKGSDVKQQEFKDGLNNFFLTLAFNDKFRTSAIYFLEYLNPKFVSMIRQGEYNYENIIENVLVISDHLMKYENNEVDGNVNRLIYDCLSQTLPPLRKSIFNETLSNKEIFIFLQIFKYFDQDIMSNDQLRCFTFFQVVMRSCRDRDGSYKKHAILIAQKVSDKTYRRMSLFMLITLIICKIWYNYCSSIKESEDLDLLMEILQGVVRKNKETFVSTLETLIKKLFEKLSGDYQRELETVSAIILSIMSMTASMPSLIPTIINVIMEKLTPEMILKNMNAFIWVSSLNKREFIPLADKQSEKTEETVDYDNYFNNSYLKSVLPLLIKEILQHCIFQLPEVYVKIVKFFTSFQTPQNQSVDKLLQSFVSNIQTMLLKDAYYKRTDNKYSSENSKEDPMGIFLKTIDSKGLEITNYWSFLFFLNFAESPSCSQYLELIFTRDYQVAELIFWIHSCYSFSILNRIVIKQYLKNRIKELIRNNDEKNQLKTYLKNMEYIVEYSTISSDQNLLGAIYKLLFELLIFYLEKLKEYQLKNTDELELVLDFIFKVLGTGGEDSRLLPLMVYEIDNIQYNKIIGILCSIVFEFGYQYKFFNQFIKIIITLSRSEERRFIILLVQIFSTLGYHVQAWRDKSKLNDMYEDSRKEEDLSLQDELFSKLRITSEVVERNVDYSDADVSKRQAIGLLIIESALGLNITQYVYTDPVLIETANKLRAENKLDPTSETYRTCLAVLRKMFEWLFYDTSPERPLTVYKGILPRNSNHPFDEYLRKTVLENHFLLSIIQMLISTTDSPGLSEMTLCILANLISVYNDKNVSTKPHLTTKIIIQTLAQRDIIDKRLAYLGEVVDRLRIESLKDMLMIIFNLICQFNTFNTKKASEIEKSQLVFYRSNMKAIFLDEIKNISSIYKHIKDVFL